MIEVSPLVVFLVFMMAGVGITLSVAMLVKSVSKKK